MRVSCSRVQLMNTCGRQYAYRYVERWDPSVTPFALLFGRVVDEVLSTYIRSHALGDHSDPVNDFSELFETEFADQPIRYPANWDLATARDVGRILVERFPEAWEKSRLVALLDNDGSPLVQKRLEVPIPNSPHTIVMVLDVVVLDTMTGSVAVLDLKTASQALKSESHFAQNAFQLTTYQYGADIALKPLLGNEPISGVGYMELIKRKPPKSKGKGPTVEAPLFMPRRTPQQVSDMLRNYLFAIRDIEAKRFLPMTSLAFNSPCDMCDYAKLCVHGDAQGLRKREIRAVA